LRHTHFYRIHVTNGTNELVPFGPEHFQHMGLHYAPMAGMSQLEAYELVNKWNLQHKGEHYVYGL
jgi:hypothetical protein